MGRSDAYSAVSPTKTPPSSVRASSETTSLRYVRATGSANVTSSAPGVSPNTSPKLAASMSTPLSLVPSGAGE